MNLFNIRRAFKTARDRDWSNLYIFVDLHDTICPADYSKEVPTELFPGAEKTLNYLSSRADIKLILWTCSSSPQIRHTEAWLFSLGIRFNYTNINPEVKNTKYGDFQDKPYMNVILDDKAGFEAEIDWPRVYEEFVREPLLT